METKLANIALALLFGTSVASSFGPDAQAVASDTDVAQPSGDDLGELAKKLNNPTASLINVPLQNNFDFGGGPNDDGFQYKLNIQPVIPFKLNEYWKILSRTILSYIYQENLIGTSSQSGLADTSLTLWLSPEKEKKEGVIIWGLGPVFLLPTATDDLLGSEKWGAGPSAILGNRRNKHVFPIPVLSLAKGCVLLQPGQVQKTAWLGINAGVIVPISGWRTGVVELLIAPTMRLRVAIHKSEIRGPPVIIAWEMIDGLGVHVDAEHWPA
jgi:hypothetical protein